MPIVPVAASVVRIIWAPCMVVGAGRIVTWLGAAGRMIRCTVDEPPGRD